MKEPWGYEDSPWKNKTEWMTFLRGCLRSAWSKHPTKHNVIKKSRKKIPNPNPRGRVATVWGFTCPLCGGTFPTSEGQVDHIVPAGSLLEKEDIQGFVERLLWVVESDLRLICKTCNSALSLGQKQGISFNEARANKEAIALVKAKKDLQWLQERGIVAASSQQKRREQIVEQLIKERSNEQIQVA